MKVLITGANGFVGKNLQQHLSERKDVEVISFTRENSLSQLPAMVHEVDFIFHLAGVNRPQNPAEFVAGNRDLTRVLCDAVAAVMSITSRKIPIIYTSSTQAKCDNLYGVSKRAAEDALFALQRKHGVPVYVFRLPNVFGKWCKPNYNSVVATFCYNIIRDLPIQIKDPAAPLALVYIDDVLQQFVKVMDGVAVAVDAENFATITPEYSTTVGEVARLIQVFKASRETLMSERVGVGLKRALYSTYVSYIPPGNFSYIVPMYSDQRGVFSEMLKTPDCGQFSYFTLLAGFTRGGHYHNSKTEKFLVIKGVARFKFRNMHTGESYELTTSGSKAEIVETVPGWTHDITNIGTEEMIVMLWANEVFDRQHPDTFICSL